MEKEKRLLSLDALRGFDMLWISGVDMLIPALALATGWPLFKLLSFQMEHGPWEGFVFYDMIFPLFLFISGITLPISLLAKLNKGVPKKKLYLQALQRLLLLVAFGAIYNGFLNFDWENTRYASVLGRIGFAWFFAFVIVLNTKLRGQIIWFVSILLGYWAILFFIPYPGHPVGDLSNPDFTIVSYVDQLLLPGKLYYGSYDPEGILSTLPAIATALLGVFCGTLLQTNSSKINANKKVLIIAGAGFVSLLLGYIWGIWLPIIKNIWTSSFVLVAGGWSLLLMALFYYLIDVLGYKKWSLPFVYIGLNAITLYMLHSGFLNFGTASKFLLGGVMSWVPESWGQVIYWSGYSFLSWLVVYFLYKHKIFLKV